RGSVWLVAFVWRAAADRFGEVRSRLRIDCYSGQFGFSTLHASLPLTSCSQFVLISQTASPAVNAPEGGDRGRKLGGGFGDGGGRGDQDLRRRRTSRVAGNAPRNHSWKAKWGGAPKLYRRDSREDVLASRRSW